MTPRIKYVDATTIQVGDLVRLPIDRIFRTVTMIDPVNGGGLYIHVEGAPRYWVPSYERIAVPSDRPLAPSPGPWEAVEWTCHAPTTIKAADGTVVAEFSGFGRHTDECIPDARLGAAAPQLLEALELADALLSGANMNRRVVERKVRTALAKAKGAANG